MSIVELIERVGVNNIRIQFIDQCADNLNWSAKRGVTRITFGVEQPLTPHGTEKFGVIVWMDRSSVESAFAESREP